MDKLRTIKLAMVPYKCHCVLMPSRSGRKAGEARIYCSPRLPSKVRQRPDGRWVGLLHRCVGIRKWCSPVRSHSFISTGLELYCNNKVLKLAVSFCCFGQVLTQTGITWNLSPIGKVMPKPWREPEE